MMLERRKNSVEKKRERERERERERKRKRERERERDVTEARKSSLKLATRGDSDAAK